MSLGDVMGHAGLTGYAILAMILFMLAAAATVVWIYWPGRRRELDKAARLPLDDDTEATPPAPRPGANR